MSKGAWAWANIITLSTLVQVPALSGSSDGFLFSFIIAREGILSLNHEDTSSPLKRL
ncbi:hypothetical protein F511_43172 [Dorcoceras hygrometricum]|uniref:Uncharacterized protein n=1 Tax=Dorcoceras hygrometricum TaxID=472368 RepID=A0A2Z6ZZ94_9LAMI|nr:hypothetical protein F511_43172 [Dorcoceras hygrometricum]